MKLVVLLAHVNLRNSLIQRERKSQEEAAVRIHPTRHAEGKASPRNNVEPGTDEYLRGAAWCQYYCQDEY
jgi:hypothetical protein